MAKRGEVTKNSRGVVGYASPAIALTDGTSITLDSTAQPGATNTPAGAAMSRKIIYDAQVDLVRR